MAAFDTLELQSQSYNICDNKSKIKLVVLLTQTFADKGKSHSITVMCHFTLPNMILPAYSLADAVRMQKKKGCVCVCGNSVHHHSMFQHKYLYSAGL